MGPEDPHPRPLSRPARLQQGPLGLRQRHPLDRPGPGRHPALDHQALGLADPQPARPHAEGQRQARPPAQDHRRAGPADDRLPEALAARGRADRRRRPGLQRHRAGPVLPPPRRAADRPAAARRPALRPAPGTPAPGRSGGPARSATGCPTWRPSWPTRRRPGSRPTCGGTTAATASWSWPRARPVVPPRLRAACRSAGCSAATPRGSSSRGPSSRPTRATRRRRSSPSSSAAGRWRRPSRRLGPTSGSRRSGSGRTWRSSGRRPACSGCTRWWRRSAWPCTKSARRDPDGGLVPEGGRRPSPTSWRRSGVIAGTSWIFGYPRATRPVWKSPGRNWTACSTRPATHIDPYKVELSSTLYDSRHRMRMEARP